MRTLGHVLMWGGFLAAAFVSLSQLEVADDKWSTIPWGQYFGAMAVGVTGVFLLRTTRKQMEADDETHEAEYSVLRLRLQEIEATIERMAEQSKHDPAEVLHQIDEQCAERLSDFAEARQTLVRRFGLNVYADVMTEFASAERYINRCWSAAADGYVDEIRACLNRARSHLNKTSNLIAAAEQTHSRGFSK
jgi:hypothetical protein